MALFSINSRTPYEPSWAEIVLGALLSLLLGAFVAILYLAVQPVECVAEMPAEPDEKVQYFVQGKCVLENARNWERKQADFLAGRSVEVSEDELNVAVATLAGQPIQPTAAPAKAPQKKDPKAAGAKPAEEESEPLPPADLLTPQPANFRIVDGKLQVGLPVILNMYDLAQTTVLVQATGAFQKEGERFVFVPEHFSIGTCPMHDLPKVGDFVWDQLKAKVVLPEEFQTAWGKLVDVKIEGNALHLIAAAPVPAQ